MSKDLKFGMLIGLVLVIAGVVIISVWPGRGIEDRLMEGGPDLIVEPAGRGLDAGLADPPEPAEEVEEVIDPVDPVDPGETMERVAEHVIEEFANPPVDTSPRVHIVADNESLSGIAQLHYGDASKWPLIAEANKEVVKNAHSLSPGMRLVIPKP